MHATETCYGFACDALDQKTVNRLYRIKKMSADKPSSIMVADFTAAKKYGKFNGFASRLARAHWPGPLTIIVPRKKSLPRFLNPKISTIGIRVPNHGLTLKILRAYPRPLITTSANISGKKEIYSVRAFLKSLTKTASKTAPVPDLTIDSGAIPRRKPSTIVSIEKNKIKILRQGEIKI